MAEEAEEEHAKRTKESAEVGKAMDTVAAGGADKAVDTKKATAAVQKLEERKAQDAEKTRQRAKELAAVSVAKEDILVVAKEFQLANKVAETQLRENGGDLRTTLRALLNEGLPSKAAVAGAPATAQAAH